MNKAFRFLSFMTVGTLLTSIMLALPSNAQLSNISISTAAAEPTSYNHASGGGKWNGGVNQVDIEQELNGEDFACNDRVSYLTKVNVPNLSDLQTRGAMTLRLRYEFSLDTTGQSGLALNTPFTATVNDFSDSASKGDGNSTVANVITSITGTPFTQGAKLNVSLELTDIEANETVVLRTTVLLACKAGSSPTGNIQEKFVDAALVYDNGNQPVSPAADIGAGANTIVLKNSNQISKPALAIAKTVNFSDQSCPGSESVTIEPDQFVKYCYVITNPSNTGNKVGAPVYNLSVINDDSGQYPDFTVPISSGLADIDGDGQTDDLAPGTIALAEKLIAFDGDKDSTVTNLAVITGTDAPTSGNTLTTSDTATVYIDAPEPLPSIEIQKTPDSQTVFDGVTATFTITVTNTGNVTLTNVSVSDTATPSCNNSWSSLAAAQSATYTCSTVALFASFTNTAVVTGNYETTQVTDEDSALVTVDFLPKIEVTKSASTSSLPETGGSLTYTVTVMNKAVENFILNSLVDDKFGNLNGVGSCSIPQTIAPDAQYSCTFTKELASNSLTPHTNIVTAGGEDPEGNQTSANDNETVTFTDVLPDIALTKTVNPTAARWTGDYVNYTFKISNLTGEPVTVTSFIDNAITLSSECLALVGYVLAPNAFVECATNNYYLTGAAGGSFINTATAIATDNEGNTDSATASATVNFWWYGRTPGYWKNHSEAWISGYTPSMFIQNVFNVPSGLLSGINLDLDKNGAKDSLMSGLGYQGGSGITGAAQILFRAAIAALLNEAYYGVDYPAEASTSALINKVNTALATNNRAQYLALASYYDFWNNAVHASLP